MNARAPDPRSDLVMRRHGYSDRPDGVRPLPLGLSLGVTTALFAAYLLAPQQLLDRIPDFKPIVAKHIPLITPPEVEPKPEAELQKPIETTVVIPRPPLTKTPNNPIETTGDRTANNDFTPGPVGPEFTLDPPPKPAPLPPVLTKVAIDPRFASRFQPDYPPQMLRLEREGVARVRVLVGADGRVKDIADAGSTQRAFFEATRDHARRNWIFKPATRDGQPYDSWYTMTVTFQLKT